MKMFFTNRKIFVEVVAVYSDRTAMIFDPYIASRNGSAAAWSIVKLKHLIPAEYVDEKTGGFISKTEKNKLKERLTLHNTEWEATDGSLFTDVEDAISYEQHLVNREMIAENSNVAEEITE